MTVYNTFYLHCVDTVDVIKMCVLTVHADFDPFADRRWYRVGGDAEIGAHIQATDPMQFQRGFHPFAHCAYR